MSTTTVTQKYRNPSSSPATHTKYLFPIYDGSAVTAFKCWIGKDKLLEGAVKPKQQAQKEFAEAVSKHKAAVLVEELTPEIFETNLGNIPSKTELTVQITLATQLRVDQTTGAITLTIPTSVAPRYGHQPERYTQPETTSQEAVAGQEALQINVDVYMPEAIRNVESHTHMICVDLGSQPGSVDIDRRKASASLAGCSAALEKDFVLMILPNSSDWKASRAIAVPQPDSQKSTIALSLSPGDLFRKNFNPEDFTGEVIFIADRSGSMREKIAALRDVMRVFVRSLPERCSFNIVSFGSNFSWLWETSQPYSEASLRHADCHVNSFDSNYGGTEILSALESIPMHFNKQEDAPTNVIVLTDGETYDVEGVIKFVRSMVSKPENNIRFFALGIGDQVSHRLVNGIGFQGSGCAEVISDTESSLMWQGRVIQMLKNALTPSRLRCSIGFSGLTKNETDESQAPHIIPPLNAFSQHSVYYMLDKVVEELPDTLNITATTEDGMKLTTELPIHKSNTHSIHHLAAKAFMNDYETGQSWLHVKHASLKADDEAAFNHILEHEAQKLGVKWSIPSRWTSYVAVDRNSQEDHEASLETAEPSEVQEASDSESDSELESESDEEMGFYLYDSVSSPGLSRQEPIRFLRSASSSSNDDASPAAPSAPYVAPNNRTGGVSSASRGSYLRPASVESREPSTVHGSFEGQSTSEQRFAVPTRHGLSGLRELASVTRDVFETHGQDSSRGAFGDRLQSEQRFDGPSTPDPGRKRYMNKSTSSKPHAPRVSEEQKSSEEAFQPEFNLSTILHSQAANGDMRVEGSDIEGPILGCYGPSIMEEMSRIFTSFSVKLDTKERVFLLNVLAVVYVTVKYADLKGLWEMQIGKARRYLRRQLEEVVPGTHSKRLEKLESEAVKSLVLSGS